MLAHLGAGSLKKSNFLIFSKVSRKGADQAKYIKGTDYVVYVLISFPQMSITSPMPDHGWVRILKSRQITSFAKIDQRVYLAN